MKIAFQQIWRYLRPYKNGIFFALFLGLVLGQLSVLLPALVNILIAGLQGKSILQIPMVEKVYGFSSGTFLQPLLESTNGATPMELVTFVALAFPVYYLIYGLVRYFHFFIVKYISEKVVANIRVKLMEKFLDMDVMYLHRSESGSGGLLSRTLNDTLVLQQGFQYYGDLVREPITGLFVIGFMFLSDWKMTLGCFIFLPLFLFVIRYVTKSLKKFGHQSQESLEDVTKILKEGLDGVRIIQSFNLQSRVKNKFSNQVEDYLSKRKKIIKREELGSPINEWFASILVCGLCLFQAYQISKGESDVGTFIGFVFAAGLLDKPIKKTQQAVIRIQQNIVALERLNEIFDSETAVEESRSPVSFPEDWDKISFENIKFAYKEQEVLSNLNLDVKRGEIIAIVGESGSGKSTLVNLLLRFFDPTEGRITIGDVPIGDLAIADLRSKVGLVTQDVFLFDDNLENNIGYGNLDGDRSQILKSAQMANAMTFIDPMPEGLKTQVGERGNRLSGGEKQRVSIARAIYKNAPILILDEATSALDSASEVEVQKGIHELIDGRTAFVIAHRLSTIAHADRILVMKKGEIVEQGNHTSLLAQKGAYAHFYNLQFRDQ